MSGHRVSVNCRGVRYQQIEQRDSEKDEFLFQLQLPKTTATRRGILSSLASLYDPMGFVAPWLLPGKILLQDLCRKKVTWDETLYEADHKTMQDRWMSLSKPADIRLPRRIPGIRKGEQIELHVFADASEVGYVVVAYSCSSRPGGRKHSSTQFAKARLATLKAVSITRLELAAAVVAVRVVKVIERCLNTIEWTATYWTDSAIALHYASNVRTRFGRFVANRLAVIHEEAEKRFVGRRGNPSSVFSDNGSNFVGAKKELSDWLMRLDKCALQDRLLPPGTQWYFKSPYSGHRGGV
ncbi:unnamed protein product [Echinostoma caproni]|uniref:Integrase catalytic domain-containing protein n=1 Tax=Echinostoma caproni TaxID=27848 RepID=A0A183AZU8_9TREM|nr:unnamed protein product [Echinostoma caproni]